MKPSYAATVEYLFGLLPMYQRTGAFVGKIDLDKTRDLLAALGNPHEGRHFVHVGGTNGKGSVSHAIATLCTAAGLKAGLYTSPHYVDYRERIRVDGEMISEAFVVDFVEEHRDLIEETQASFFEFTVAMAFAYFAAEEVDLAVIEVGLGGRLDSTNVITPLLSVITNIGLDHTEVLGETLKLIAAEKAGIMKPERPVVVGRFQEQTWPVFRAFADRLPTQLFLASDLIDIHESEDSIYVQAADTSEYKSWDVLPKGELSIRGPYAVENIRTALAAHVMLQRTYPPGRLGLADCGALRRMEELSGYQGRFVRFRQNELSARVIADAAHNIDGWRGIVPAVVGEAAGQRIHVVCGFVKGKNPLQFVSLWPAHTRLYLGLLDLPRAQPLTETQDALRESGYPLASFDSIASAYEAAQITAAPDELIFVGGSSFVVGEWMGEL